MFPSNCKLRATRGATIAGDGTNTTIRFQDGANFDGILTVVAPDQIGTYGVEFSGQGSLFGGTLIVSGSGSNANGIRATGAGNLTTIAGAVLVVGTWDTAYTIDSGAFFRTQTMAIATTSVGDTAINIGDGEVRWGIGGFNASDGVVNYGLRVTDPKCLRPGNLGPVGRVSAGGSVSRFRKRRVRHRASQLRVGSIHGSLRARSQFFDRRGDPIRPHWWAWEPRDDVHP